METTTLPLQLEGISREIAAIEHPMYKTITWETNFNNKMVCDAFVHIDIAPRRKPLHSELDRTIVEIRTADQSHPPTKNRLYDMLFIPFKELSDQLAFSSHGMTAMELANYFFNKHQSENFSWNTEVAIYFYLKFKV